MRTRADCSGGNCERCSVVVRRSRGGCGEEGDDDDDDEWSWIWSGS